MYTYKDSGRDGYDILVVTKQGHEKSGLPCGVVIPIGDCYVPHGMFSFEHILDFEEKHGLTESMAMHSPGNQNQVLSIRSGSHYMNRFGLFLSAADPFADSGEDYDIPGGSLQRKTIASLEETLPYLFPRKKKGETT